MTVFDALHRILDEGGRAVVLTVVSGENTGAKLPMRLGAKLLVRQDGTTVGSGPPELAALAPAALRRGRSHVLEQDGITIFADVFAPPPRLFVYGAVDVAEALCRAAKLVGWTSVVADARARFATRERLPSADEILVAWPEEAVCPGPARHRHRCRRPHARRQVRRAGAGGGARERGVLHRRPRLRGATRSAGASGSSRRACPRRLSLGSRARAASTSAPPPPRRRSLSMLAEMLATRAGRSGGLLRDAVTRIHAEPPVGKK